MTEIDKPIILIVDDEPVNLIIMEDFFGKKYVLHTAANGEECLQQVEQVCPDLILLDVNMPKMSGLDVCKQLKDDFETAEIPIIFVSALSSSDDRLAGYIAGAEDYVTKPFDENELEAKIDRIISSAKLQKNLKENISEATKMAMIALSSAGEMGQVLQFTRDSHQCSTYKDLAELLITTYEGYGLNVTIRMNDAGDVYYYSHTTPVGEMEKSIFESAHNTARFVDYRTRTLMNYERVSVLVKNMPLDDDNSYGRLKDCMGYLGETAEARAIALDMELTLQATVKSTIETLKEIQSFRANAFKTRELFSDVVGSVEESYLTLGLSEEQEEALSALLLSAEQSSSKLYEEGLDIDDRLAGILVQLVNKEAA